MLQVHPCYMVNWITKTPINRQPKEVVRVLRAVYGHKEVRNNTRIIHLLMVIARKQLQFELATFDLKEILWGRTDSTFVQIFNLIFESQDVNRRYITSLVTSILQKLHKYIKNLKIQDIPEEKLFLLFEYEQANDLGEDRIKKLVQFCHICLKKIAKSLNPQFHAADNSFLSDEVLSMVATASEDIYSFKYSKGISERDQEIDIYMMNLVFEHLIRRLRELQNIDQVKELYWLGNPKEVDEAKILQFGDKRNLVAKITDHIEKYLNLKLSKGTNTPQEINEFIKDPKYRNEISRFLIAKPFQFDMILVKDLFLNSMEMREQVLTISVEDLIFVYNTLIEKAPIILIPDTRGERWVDEDGQDEDPVGMLLEALGGRPIEIKRNERQLIADETLQLKVNLQIKYRLLIEHQSFAKCQHCWHPVSRDMIPERRFNEGIQGRPWKCTCSKQKTLESGAMRCPACCKHRPESSLSRDALFGKYLRTVADPAADVFQKILVYIPIVDKHQKINKVLEYETKVELDRKNPDYQKLETIEQFKKLIADYVQEKKRGVKSIAENGSDEQVVVMQLEDKYLKELAEMLQEAYDGIRGHEALLQCYSQMLQEVKDKLYTTFQQKHHQQSEEFKTIKANAFTGMGSEFLRDFEKQDIFAGKLHLKTEVDASQNGGGPAKPKKANPKLDEFFKQLDKPTEGAGGMMAPEPKVGKEQFKANFGFFGKYPMYMMRQRKILINIQIEGKKLDTIMKKSSYVFYDDCDHGFKVELIYEEVDSKCLIFGMTSHEAILETFTIQKHMLAEMRRTFTTKSTIMFGNSEFNVFELVFLLNEIKSRIYQYGVQAQQGNKKGTNPPLPTDLPADNKV